MASPEIFDIPIGKVVGPKGDTGNGISGIELLSTSGLNKTYRITMTDETTFYFTVTDGNGISGATFDAQTNALTITFDNGTSFTTPSLKGAPGNPGDDGYSPAVTIETIPGGHRVTITDKAHPTGQSFDVMDGAPDAGNVSYDETATYQSGTVGAELQHQSRHLSDVEDTKAPVILETVSGAIASFDDGADSMPIRKIVATIEPVQAGTGDPSPDNVRPISGWTGATVYHRGKNLYDYNSTPIRNCGVSSGVLAYNNLFDAYIVPIKQNTTYIYSKRYNANTDGYICLSEDYPQTGTTVNNVVNTRYGVPEFTVNSGTNNYLIIIWRNVLSAEERAEQMVEVGNARTAVEPYQGEITDINWQSEAGTIYGGTVTLNEDGSVDVVSTMGNIASYTGETLPGAWISSMDVYAEGATPTTGAQVVYELAEPVSYHFDDVGQLYTYLGTNNVWIDTGAISECDYPADTKTYVDDKSASVTDVQINGTSILSDGVANIPIAGSNNLGLVKAASNSDYGVAIYNNGIITLASAGIVRVKAGSSSTTPITPSLQDAAAFYGLAKAAGDTTQTASANAVGAYTEAAKSAIHEMLNGSVAVSGTTPTIAAKSGITYVCGEVATLDITPPASGIFEVQFVSGSTPTVLTATGVSWVNGFDPTALEANKTYDISISNGIGVAVWI